MIKKGKSLKSQTGNRLCFKNKEQQLISPFSPHLKPPSHLSKNNSPLAYLTSLDTIGIRFGLGPVRRLLNRLGNPQNAYKAVLIGGTNGKGSIAAMISAILVNSGYRVGLYTSPHLVDFRERIQINGRMISKKDTDIFIDAVRQEVAEEVTWFEFVTAMAFLYFQKKGVDIAVLEVGMGGRLDATNVCRPMISVISNISLEHRAYLGNQLQDIAYEKAGIIRKGTVCVTGAKQPCVRKVLIDICLNKKTQIYTLGKDFRVRKNRKGGIDYFGYADQFKGVFCPLRGRHQLENAATALAAIEKLRMMGMPISQHGILQGMQDTKWEGRLEVMGENPAILLDGAHNPAGVSALCRALRDEFSYRKLIIVFGALGDKDIGRMLGPLCRVADRLILTKPDVERASPVKTIFHAAKHRHGLINVFEDSGEAVRFALEVSSESDLICITGSLYLVGEVKKTFPLSIDYAKSKLPK